MTMSKRYTIGDAEPIIQIYHCRLIKDGEVVADEYLPAPDTRFASVVYTPVTGLFFVQEHPEEEK